MNIFVDADACPVLIKNIIIYEATRYSIPITFVTSFSHFSNAEQPDGVEMIYVDLGRDVADYRIIELAVKGDIVVTHDYGLASLALGKKCIVLHHRGFRYTNKNIGKLLQTRYIHAQARKRGFFRTKVPKIFTEDREPFNKLLRRVISEHYLA